MELDYPETRRESVTETMGGVTFDDPYRWLESETDEVRDWQAAQNRLAEETLRSWPGFEEVRKAVERLSVDTRVFAPRASGGKWFQHWLPTPESDQPALVVRDHPSAPPRILLDPNQLSAERGMPVSADWFTPSPDGRIVGIGLSEAGDEQSVLHLVDVESGELLDDRIPFMGSGAVAWLPDASGLYYNGGLGPQSVTMDRRIFFHKVGSPVPGLSDYEDLDLVGAMVVPQVSDDGRYVAAISGDYRIRPYFYLDRDAGKGWQPLLKDLDGLHYLGFFDGDEYVALTTDGAPLGRVVTIPLATPTERGTWRELVPESEANIRGLARASKSRFLVADLVDARTRIRVFERDGTALDDVPLPGPGVFVAAIHWATFGGVSSPDSAVVSLAYTAVDTSPAVYLYDLDSRTLEEHTPPAHRASGIVTRQEFAESADGTRVPMTVVHREDLPNARPQPALIYAYGGFNIPHLASYSPMHLAFVESGGVLVLPNLRGGGEYGEAWWEAGRRANKQNTFDDLYAVAETLVDSGIAQRGRVAVEGRSNGGLLTGVAVTQRPDLWAAVVSIVPIYDLFRTVLLDPYGSYATTYEYGDPRVPKEAEWLIKYSPYQNARGETAYPATLISAGGNDVRCPPWHARKLAAALQAAAAADNPVLLRVHQGIGHGVGRPTSAAIDNESEWISFAMAHLGMEPAATRPS